MNTWTHFNIPSALTIVPWAKHPLNLGRSHQTHTHISSSVIFFFNPLPFFHSLFYYLTFIFGFVDVCDNTEANMRADRFGRKPLTGIIRVEVEEWRRGGWKEQMSGGRLTVFDLRGTLPPPGWVSRPQRAGKGGGKWFRFRKKVKMQGHRRRKDSLNASWEKRVIITIFFTSTHSDRMTILAG